jgi:hypothetical protein
MGQSITRSVSAVVYRKLSIVPYALQVRRSVH